MPSITHFFEEAFERRKKHLEELASHKTNAWRLYCGEKEGLKGITADAYGSVVVISLFEELCALTDEELTSIAEWLTKNSLAITVYAKRLHPDRFRQTTITHMLLCGEPTPAQMTISENNFQFIVRPFEGFSPGIFLDQRDNRRFLSALGAGQNVLNGFSYTCTFSVYCAQAKSSTTNVDLSKKYLEWGKLNFELNNLAVGNHRFVIREMRDFLTSLAKREERFQLIILDPPSFSRDARGNVFQVSRDAVSLIEGAERLLAKGGYLFFSSNYSKWNRASIEKIIFEVFTRNKRKFQVIPLPPPPLDFKWERYSLRQVLVKALN